MLLLAWPGFGVLAVLWWVGAFAIVFGVLTIALGFRLRGMRDRVVRRPA